MLDIRNPTGNTKLGALDELMFQRWMEFTNSLPGRQDLNPSPDAPGHLYDYRGQYKAGVPMLADPSDSYNLHGDSRFKKPGHSRSIVEYGDGFLDTKTGRQGSFTDVTSPPSFGFNDQGYGQAFRSTGQPPIYGFNQSQTRPDYAPFIDALLKALFSRQQ